jgi:hypothetical protein
MPPALRTGHLRAFCSDETTGSTVGLAAYCGTVWYVEIDEDALIKAVRVLDDDHKTAHAVHVRSELRRTTHEDFVVMDVADALAELASRGLLRPVPTLDWSTGSGVVEQVPKTRIEYALPRD